MGGQVSLESNLEENQVLRRFCGLEPLSDNAPDWNQLLSFNITQPKTKAHAKLWYEKCEDLCQSLLLNTCTTANFAAFIRVLLRRTAEIKSSAQCDEKIFIWQATNGVTILKFACRYFSSRLTESQFESVFRKQVLNDDGKLENIKSELEAEEESPVEELINALIEIIVDVPLNDSTEKLHLETIHCLLEMLSVEMYYEKPVASIFFKYFVAGRCTIHAPLLTKQLLLNFVNRVKPVLEKSSAPSSLVIGLATSMWNVLQLGGEDNGGEGSDVDLESVGSCSLLLLLILVAHHHPQLKLNPYHAAISSFQNTQELSSFGNATESVVSFKVDFSRVYERLCASVTDESPMLLLYFLLHKNSGFRNFLLSRVNLENLVLPVLRVLNSGQAGTSVSSHHVYLSLIVTLILSEDDFFCKVVHETVVKSNQCDWFSERPVSDISLGGLIILVLTKTIQYNVVKVRDRYLHTNCLAALANMSAHFKQLTAPVCQKLVGLLELLTKRHAKLVENMRQTAEYDLTSESDQNLSYQQQDITALEEGMRTLLEIMNSCVCHGLRHNPHLVYTMLYKRQLFDAFHQHPMFQDIIWNLSALLNHFSGRVSSLGSGASVSEVLDAIQKGAIQWPTDRLKKFPELKFKYIEDDNTEEFFIPYVWAIMCKQSHYYTDPTKIKLFNAHINLVK